MINCLAFVVAFAIIPCTLTTGASEAYILWMNCFDVHFCCVQCTLNSWVEYDSKTDFPIQNLPYGIIPLVSHQNNLAGVFRIPSGGDSRIGVAIGDHVLDLHTLAIKGFFDEAHNLQGGTCFLKVIS